MPVLHSNNALNFSKMTKVKIHDKEFAISIPYEKIKSVVEEMAEKMNRDLEGKRPLFLCILNGSFMFGSEIKCFLEHPHFVKELNENALENYLTFQYSPTDETFFNKSPL